MKALPIEIGQLWSLSDHETLRIARISGDRVEGSLHDRAAQTTVWWRGARRQFDGFRLEESLPGMSHTVAPGA